ncbi:MAG TPA: ATP-binding protein [Thermoanaerobaculia bacterium]|nr:ATP-binding protein [Thermoanaerobaculia bacterium]
MTLRAKFILYLIALHVILGAAAAYYLHGQPSLLFAAEALFVVSIAIGWRLINVLFVPLDLIRTGAELIGERDFTTRFVNVGQPEMDALVAVYNRMIDRLRDERLAAEERHQLLQKVVEVSPAGIVICDFDGKVETMNPAAQRILERTDAAKLTEGMMTLAGNRRVKVWRREFRDRGFVKSFFLIEEMTDELRRSEKAAYEKMIRMMSHEVNNSVGAVRSLLDSSLRYAPQIGDPDREDFVQALTIASHRIDALNAFMRGFADVVRIPPPHRTRVRIAPMIGEIARLLAPELEARRIAFRSDVRDEIYADIDQSQFEQVIVNVLRNAMEAVDHDGAIDVIARDGILTISDTGAGIPADARDDLFTPFFSTKRDGRGLGLALVQEILTNHGAAFWLENRAGGGAEFGIRLPLERG